MKPRNLAIGALAITLLAALGLGAARFGLLPMSSVHAATVAAPIAPARPQFAVTLPDFSSIVARNGAAVVNISTTQEVKTGGNVTPLPNIDPYDPFYELAGSNPKRNGASVSSSDREAAVDRDS